MKEYNVPVDTWGSYRSRRELSFEDNITRLRKGRKVYGLWGLLVLIGSLLGFGFLGHYFPPFFILDSTWEVQLAFIFAYSISTTSLLASIVLFSESLYLRSCLRNKL